MVFQHVRHHPAHRPVCHRRRRYRQQGGAQLLHGRRVGRHPCRRRRCRCRLERRRLGAHLETLGRRRAVGQLVTRLERLSRQRVVGRHVHVLVVEAHLIHLTVAEEEVALRVGEAGRDGGEVLFRFWLLTVGLRVLRLCLPAAGDIPGRLRLGVSGAAVSSRRALLPRRAAGRLFPRRRVE